MTVDRLMNMFSMVMHFHGAGNATIDEYMELHSILQNNNMTVSQLTNRLSPTCADLLERCMWKGTQSRCDTLFQSINTTEGVCCSFNYYAVESSYYQMYTVIHDAQLNGHFNSISISLYLHTQ